MRAKNSEGVYSNRTDKFWKAAELAPQFGSSTFTVTEVNTNCVMLEWQEPEFPGGTIQSYQYNCAKRGWKTAAPDITETHSCGYEPNTQVNCYLVARNTLNSTEILATGYTCSDLVATFSLSAEKIGQKTAIVVDLQDSTGRCQLIKQYVITVAAENGSLVGEYSRKTHGRFNISDLNGFTHYNVSVSVINSVNLSSITSLTIITAETDVPEKPKQLQLQSNESCVDLSVTAPDAANGIITEYQFTCNEDKNWLHQLDGTENGQTELITSSVCGFPSATKITCSAAALNSVGVGPPIFNITFTLLQLKSPTDNYISVGGSLNKKKTVEITITRAMVENVDVSFYYILVEQDQQNSRTKRDAAQTCSTETVSKGHSEESLPLESCYVTAKITAEELGDEYVFNIGDDQTYGGFRNVPLEGGSGYLVYLALEALVDEKVSLIKLLPPSKFEFDPQNSNAGTIAGAVIGVLLIIAAGCFAVYLVYRCRRMEKPPINEFGLAEASDRLAHNRPGGPNEQDNVGYVEIEENDLYGNSQGTRSEPVLVEKLGWFISTNQETISAQYADLKKVPLPPTTAALSPENAGKCRYKNLYPGDNYRVKLQRDDVHQTDFINASYMKGYNREIGYIASMGPSNEEISCDFWLMTWQQNPSAIVMVTRAKEDTKMKCWQYWPLENGKSKTFGEFSVTCGSKKTYPDFCIRYLEVVKNGEKRVIPHFNYLTWPDHGIPDIEVLAAFHRLVKSTIQMADEQPLLVHCSAGVGRTGTYIALDYLIEQAKAEGMVDMYTYVAEMRSRRPSMIQTEVQYLLLHQALYESLTTETFPCSPPELQLRLSLHQQKTREKTDSVSVEYQHILDRVNSLTLSYESGKMQENQDKNRFSEILPCEEYRLFLSNGFEGNYINAVTVNGHRTKGQWIATQSPLSYTIRDFWELMMEQDVEIVIQLEGTQNPFYPLTDTNKMFIDPFTITRKSSKDGEHVKTIDILLQKDGVRPEEKRLKVLMAKNWSSESLPPTRLFIALQAVVEQLLHQTGSFKICVVCQDGSTRCGLYICVHNAIEKLKVEQQVNIYYPTVMAKLRRPQFIPTLEQYSYLYQVVNDYAEDFGDYANFG